MIRNVRLTTCTAFGSLILIGLIASARAHIQSNGTVWTVDSGSFSVTAWTDVVNPPVDSTVGQTFLFTTKGGVNILPNPALPATNDVDFGWQHQHNYSGHISDFHASQVFTVTIPQGSGLGRTPETVLFHNITDLPGSAWADGLTTAHPLSTEDWISAQDVHFFTLQ